MMQVVISASSALLTETYRVPLIFQVQCMPERAVVLSMPSCVAE